MDKVKFKKAAEDFDAVVDVFSMWLFSFAKLFLAAGLLVTVVLAFYYGYQQALTKWETAPGWLKWLVR
ncbi:hypothetical protein [Methylobacter sp.]|uniref:hypothetical protein n=1 Tax=Methylobacter sp. TaxID=2051955 RepID=UPI001217EDE0|nr:hypothetical protein [Methylobacter sp.]TAK59562.1 MAG: hypothetical protein EPO18_20590 [Methylobacter sp.]